MDKYEKIVELARRRGFFWPSSEIYGGVRGFIDFGPLGALLKRNIEEKWRRTFIYEYQDFIVEIETPVIMPEPVFKASGHIEHFTDMIVECLKCHRMFRADHLVEEATGLKNLERLKVDELNKIIEEREVRCPECGGRLSEIRTFNLLFRTTIGPYEGNVGYARPEAAQGMFTSFKRVFEATRRRLPLGIAQIGRVMRNEISPRQGPIRLREFTIMELELFFDPQSPHCPVLDDVADEAIMVRTAERIIAGNEEPIKAEVGELVRRGIIKNEWMGFFMGLGQRFVEEIGIPRDRQLFIEKLPEERAHYALQTFDQTVWLERWGWVEVAGHSYRTDYDLSRHMKYSGQDLRVFQEYKKPRRVSKYIIRPKMEVLGPMFRGRARDIARAIEERLKDEEAVKELLESGHIIIDGLKISRDMVEVRIEEVKETGRRFIPHVTEPSFGAERLVYSALEYAYTEVEGRIVLKLPADIAPIKAVILPLISDERMLRIAEEIYRHLKKHGIPVFYDTSGSIGRRYARADEIGIPLAITVDGQTLEDNTVTVRDRDTWEQVRVPIDHIVGIVLGYSRRKITFKDLKARYAMRGSAI
ncbi:MAG: glycine--tRNA ligase [Thermoprotei archaeon]|nr:glycine--tRNA ligase [Thermoprotei archaeon]